MVDEAQYRQTQRRVNALPCVFQGALLAQHATCSLAVRKSLAEREGLSCSQPTAHLNCEMLERLLLERATFPLHLHPQAPLTHSVLMKLQCGGVEGIREALAATHNDVHDLVNAAQARFGSLTELPLHQIVQKILAWQLRRRSKRGQPDE